MDKELDELFSDDSELFWEGYGKLVKWSMLVGAAMLAFSAWALTGQAERKVSSAKPATAI